MVRDMWRVLYGDGGTARRRSTGLRRVAGLAAATALAAAVTTAPLAIAAESAARPVAAIAKAAPQPATLRLRVMHTMDGGRLILKIEDRAILSAPLAALRGGDGRPRERDLSVPGGRHALTVQVLDVRGRVVAQGIIHGTVGASDPATLMVAEHRGSGAGLTLSWRTP
jgi:hypothetical protein